MYMMDLLDKLPLSAVVVLCLTLGLAPFAPPHIWEKLVMLKNGELSRPLDWFDLFYHGVPWLLLIIKAAASLKSRPS